MNLNKRNSKGNYPVVKQFLFVAIVYNNADDTFDFLNSLKALGTNSNQIMCVLVDNSDSSDESSKISDLSKYFDFVSIVKPGLNLGYFGGFNYLIERINCQLFDYILLCNNDLIFNDDFLSILSRLNFNDDVAVICPDVITLDGVHQNPHLLKPRSIIQRMRLDIFFSHYYIGYLLKLLKKISCSIIKCRRRLDAHPSCYLHMGIGACYVVHPRFWVRANNLEYPHFLYGEEAYLSKQVHSIGLRLYFESSLKIIHKESATLSKLPKRLTYEYARSGYYSYRKFY